MTAQPILLAYDGSEDARHAIAVAGTLLTGRAIVLHVWAAPHPPATTSAVPGIAGIDAGVSEELDEHARQRAQQVADDGVLHARRAGFEAVPDLVAGDGGVSGVWSSIASIADDRDARVIIVGHRGMSRVRSVLLGSVSHGLVQHTTRPVLVVPASDT